MRKLALFALVPLALASCGHKPYKVPVAGSPVTGPADAWVTVVEFADFQCPYCAGVAPTVHQMLLTWPRDVRVVFRNMPLSFHEHAMGAAIGGVCADEQGLFWTWYDALYSDQSKLGDSDLLDVARRLSLDMDRFTTCQASAEAARKVQDDIDLAAQLGTPGTPTFYVNGVEVDGEQPFDNFRAVIGDELAKAQASGVDRASYYDKVVLGL